MSDERGGLFYDDPPVQARYTEQHVPGSRNPNHVMEEPAVLAEVGDPSGLRVIDLGCGDGRYGEHLLAAGCASYHGIDGSTLMVQRARATLAATSARIERVDIEDFRSSPGSADLITARLSLHYVANIEAVLATAAAALVAGGRIIFSVVHPVITSNDCASDGPRTSWTVDDYFHPGPRRRRWMNSQVTWHHRTVEQYVTALTSAGFTLTALRECEPIAERFDGDSAELARRQRVPLFLLLHATLN